MTALLRGGMQSGINVDFLHIGNNSLVQKARNSMISYFHLHKEYSHLIWVDADMGIPNDCVPKLLKRDVDIIGVPVPLKGYNADGSPVLNIGEILNIEDGLAETTHVGNAVLMFSRKAVDALIEISTPYEDHPSYSRGETTGDKAWDVFYVGVMEDGIYRPEDYSTCYKLRKLGFKIYLDMTIPVKHNGMHGFQTTPEILNKYIPKQDNLIRLVTGGR
jgi:hypothetical protein